MRMFSQRVVARRFTLSASVSLIALSFATNAVLAQGTDIGTVSVESTAHKAKPKAKPARASTGAPSHQAPAAGAPVVASAPGAPIESDAAIGSKAPVDSAPALAVSQPSINAVEPGSVISDKVIKDIVVPGGDYNETAKFTPNFNSQNPNGALGDSKSSWRGFADGQFDVTYDGIPFGDENDPTHHSAAYFPAPLIGKVIVDRGPGEASTIGYAPFGGTLALFSRELSDKFGGEFGGSVGNNGTYTGFATMQSGLVMGDTRAMLQYAYAKTDGALQNAHVDTNNFLGKVEKQMGDVKATFFAVYGRENYNNAAAPTWAQLQMFGNTYGELNRDPRTQQYTGYNNSQKETDMEYVKLDGDVLGFHFNNTLYSYAYTYPAFQNNGNDQTIIYNGTPATAGTVTSVKITNPGTGCVSGTACKTTLTFTGPVAGDVTGYLKFNNYRADGDILRLSRDIDAGFASGQLRLGAWAEHGDNGRYQQYYDYTTGVNYGAYPVAVGASTNLVGGAGTTLTPAQSAIDVANASYKLNLSSHLTNYQPYIEYEWKPLSNLSITPGYKYESITRDQEGNANNSTVQPVSTTKTYTASLPYLAVRYKITPNWSVYAQASKGFLIPTVSAFYTYDTNVSTIQPEQTTNFQAGTNYKTADLTLAADVYQITATNFTVSQTLPDGTTALVSNGTARYQGIEVEGTYAFGRAIGGFADGFAVTGSGSISSAKYIAGPNNGLILPNAPTYTVAGGLVYDNGMYFGSLLNKFVGDQYGSGGQTFSSATVNNQLNHVGAYNTTDLVMGIRSDFLKQMMGFGDKAEFKIGVGNVFNNRNIVDIGGTPKALTPAADVLTYTTLAGRTYYAGLKVSF